MKKIYFVIFLLIVSITKIGDEKIVEKLIDFRVDVFSEAFENVKKWEGNYSNLEHDKGGETYCGITRNFNKKWDGWRLVDEYKKINKIEWNTKIPGIESHVRNYYYSKWIEEKYYLIEESVISKYLFDYRNTGPVAIKHIKQVLSNSGHKIKINYKMDDETIVAINKMKPEIFIKKIKERRILYYENVVKRNPKLSVYLIGWKRRANFL